MAKKIKTYEGTWVRTYTKSGTVMVEARSAADAQKKILENIDEYIDKADLDYDPSEDKIEDIYAVEDVEEEMSDDEEFEEDEYEEDED